MQKIKRADGLAEQKYIFLRERESTERERERTESMQTRDGGAGGGRLEEEGERIFSRLSVPAQNPV